MIGTFVMKELITFYLKKRKIKLRKNKKQDSSTITFETGKNNYLFTFISSFASVWVCIYVQYFFDVVRNKTTNKKYLLELIKRRSKVNEKGTSDERNLNLDQ